MIWLTGSLVQGYDNGSHPSKHNHYLVIQGRGVDSVGAEAYLSFHAIVCPRRAMTVVSTRGRSLAVMLITQSALGNPHSCNSFSARFRLVFSAHAYCTDACGTLVVFVIKTPHAFPSHTLRVLPVLTA